MTIHTEEELEGLKAAGYLVSDVLHRMCRAAEPGMTTAELDALGAKWLADADAESGMVFTIEPFLSTKARHADDVGDGWTLVGPKGSVTAQYEHTLIVGRHGPIVVTNLLGLPD
jgi:methionine aminopeptidase